MVECIVGYTSKKEEEEHLLCSFCGKTRKEVKKLISNGAVHICDECISLCNAILDFEEGYKEAKEAYDEAFHVLWRIANEKAALDDQVKNLHENGNKLLEEKRELRRMVQKLNDAFVASEPDRAKTRHDAAKLLEKTA